MNNKSKQEYMRIYRQKNKEKIREYMKEYARKNKDKIYQQRKNKILENPEEYYKKRREYYQAHKESMYKSQRKWATQNERHFSDLCQKSRRKRVERLRAEGVTNAWSVVVYNKEPKYKENLL